jgi:O-antigen/teichoic acid export membrane protein
MHSYSLRKNIIFNFIGLGVPLLVAVFTIPHLIEALGIVRFGILTLIWMLISYAGLFDLGFGKVLVQQLSASLVRKEASNGARLVWTALFSSMVLSLVGVMLVYFFLSFVIQKILHVPPVFFKDTLHACCIMIFCLPCIVATDSVRGVLESHQQFFIVNSVRLPMGILTFLGPVIALQISNSLTSIAWFLAIGKIVNFLFYFYFCFEVMPSLKHNFCFNKVDFFSLFKMGSWTTVSNIVSPLMGYVDRFFIAAISVTAVAYYVTPNEMIIKLSLITGAINAVFFPEFSAGFIENTDRVKFLFARNIKLVFIILFPMVLTAIYFSHEILQVWLGNEFANTSFRVLQWFSFGVLINSLAQIPFCIIQAKGSTHLTAKIHLFELPLYSMALWCGAHYGNINTMAIIWFARMLVDAVIMFFCTHYFMKWAISRPVFLFAGFITLMIVMGFIVHNFYIRLIVVLIGLIASYYIIGSCFLSAEERDLLQRYRQQFFALLSYSKSA